MDIFVLSYYFHCTAYQHYFAIIFLQIAILFTVYCVAFILLLISLFDSLFHCVFVDNFLCFAIFVDKVQWI